MHDSIDEPSRVEPICIHLRHRSDRSGHFELVGDCGCKLDGGSGDQEGLVPSLPMLVYNCDDVFVHTRQDTFLGNLSTPRDQLGLASSRHKLQRPLARHTHVSGMFPGEAEARLAPPKPEQIAYPEQIAIVEVARQQRLEPGINVLSRSKKAAATESLQSHPPLGQSDAAVSAEL